MVEPSTNESEEQPAHDEPSEPMQVVNDESQHADNEDTVYQETDDDDAPDVGPSDGDAKPAAKIFVKYGTARKCPELASMINARFEEYFICRGDRRRDIQREIASHFIFERATEKQSLMRIDGIFYSESRARHGGTKQPASTIQSLERVVTQPRHRKATKIYDGVGPTRQKNPARRTAKRPLGRPPKSPPKSARKSVKVKSLPPGERILVNHGSANPPALMAILTDWAPKWSKMSDSEKDKHRAELKQQFHFVGKDSNDLDQIGLNRKIASTMGPLISKLRNGTLPRSSPKGKAKGLPKPAPKRQPKAISIPVPDGKILVEYGENPEPFKDKLRELAQIWGSISDAAKAKKRSEVRERFHFVNETGHPMTDVEVVRKLGGSLPAYIKQYQQALEKDSVGRQQRLRNDGVYEEQRAFHALEGLTPDDFLTVPLPRSPTIEIPLEIDGVTFSDYPYAVDNGTRVIVANFSAVEKPTDKVKYFVGELMERDDLALILEGLTDTYNKDDANMYLRYMEAQFMDGGFYPKFRIFDRVEEGDEVSYEERHGFVTMKSTDFFRYLRLRSHNPDKADFVYTDADLKEHRLDPEDVVIYMIDIDLHELACEFARRYLGTFKFPEIVPGGEWCMMNELGDRHRPFMGPNGYICPGGGFTQIHEDGFGTVDSGHSCHHGINEVVMLRRLPSCHKKNALHHIQTKRQSKKASESLFKLPHDDTRSELLWPSNKIIENWANMGYCPAVILLKAGQHLHIGKGRLHMFRKLSLDTLPESDCHSLLRQKIIKDENLSGEAPICISSAFDWNFRGVTVEGINREVSSVFQAASACRASPKAMPLAIPETALMRMAIEAIERDCYRKAMNCCDDPEAARDKATLTGILPSLEYVLARDNAAMAYKDVPEGIELEFAAKSDWKRYADEQLKGSTPSDVYDYSCIYCADELSNVYFQCSACQVRQHHFNMCLVCFSKQEYKKENLDHPWHNVNHHDSFVRKCRFRMQGQADEILQRCRQIVGEARVATYQETKAKLEGTVLDLWGVKEETEEKDSP